MRNTDIPLESMFFAENTRLLPLILCNKETGESSIAKTEFGYVGVQRCLYAVLFCSKYRSGAVLEEAWHFAV
jgi:hypothetical protein